MGSYENQKKENKRKSEANDVSQMQTSSEPTFELLDTRPEAVAQMKLQEMANNSPQVSQLQSFQETVNSSSQTRQVAQLQTMADTHSAQQQQPVQKKENNTGLPDTLKSGMENLSGMSLDDVKVHRNSDKPAAVQAHAYAQGSNIHLASGQEKHLPHELGHVVQQKEGRVKPTKQRNGKTNINDDVGLEKEADVMGAKASKVQGNSDNVIQNKNRSKTTNSSVSQLKNREEGSSFDRIGGDFAAKTTIQEEREEKIEQVVLGTSSNLEGAYGGGAGFASYLVDDGKKDMRTANEIKTNKPEKLQKDTAEAYGETKEGNNINTQQEKDAKTAGEIGKATLGFAAAAKSFYDSFTKGSEASNKKPKDLAGMAGAFKDGAAGIQGFTESTFAAASLAKDQTMNAAAAAAGPIMGPISTGISIFVNVMNMYAASEKMTLVERIEYDTTLTEAELNVVQSYVTRLDYQYTVELVDFIFNVAEFISMFVNPAVAGAIKVVHSVVNLFKGTCEAVHGFFAAKEQRAEARVSGDSGMESLNVNLSDLDAHLNSNEGNKDKRAKRAKNVFGLMKLNQRLEDLKDERREHVDLNNRDEIKQTNADINQTEEVVKDSIDEYNKTIKPEAAPDLTKDTLKDLLTVHMNAVHSIIEQTKERQFGLSWLKSKVMTLGKVQALKDLEAELKKKDDKFSWDKNDKEYDITLQTLEDSGQAGYFEGKTMTAINLADNRHFFTNSEVETEFKNLLNKNAEKFKPILMQNPEFNKLVKDDSYSAAIERYIKL